MNIFLDLRAYECDGFQTVMYSVRRSSFDGARSELWAHHGSSVFAVACHSGGKRYPVVMVRPTSPNVIVGH
jgi:hypothetical protein